MCGIVGCIGHGKIQTVVLNGLEKLEYRGYGLSRIIYYGRRWINTISKTCWTYSKSS